MITIKGFRTILLCSLLGAAAGSAQAASIVGSKHDLTMNGTVQLCVHCHTPHNANTQAGFVGQTPLWNRTITNLDAFTPYNSPTMTEVCPTRPSGISLVCLSCHDGTGGGAVHSGNQHSVINKAKAGGAINTGSDIDGQSCIKCHTGTYSGIYSSALSVMAGPDLRNDHPISMPYPVANPKYQVPPNPTTGWTDIKLYNGKVECPSCHNVHDPAKAPFLRADNGASAMCLTCHIK